MTTIADVMNRHAVAVPSHLSAQADVPLLAGMQRQGDVLIAPCQPHTHQGAPVPPAGIAVVRGEAGGNTHLLVAAGDVRWTTISGRTLELGTLAVAHGAEAYLLHPEHGAAGIAPGNYSLKRQRQQAEVERLVAD
ncbi:MAG: hypothetical protein M0Z46_20055 [Actinomycetota bacterium]|jgi:hypothetical protein|nr:hypothetical protein [Actinomycetota bacterium]